MTSRPSSVPKLPSLPSLPPAPPAASLRYFLTYRGVRLPLQMAEELSADGLANRNTFYRAGYDTAGHLCWIEQMVYGAVAMRHDYVWGDDGQLRSSTIQAGDDEPQTLQLGG